MQPARLKLILNDGWNRMRRTEEMWLQPYYETLKTIKMVDFSLEAGHHIEPGSVQPVTQPGSSAMVKCPEGKWNHSCFKGTVPQSLSHTHRHTYICAHPWITHVHTQMLFLCLFIRKERDPSKWNEAEFLSYVINSKWMNKCSPNLTLPWQQQIHTLQVALYSTRLTEDLSWDITIILDILGWFSSQEVTNNLLQSPFIQFFVTNSGIDVCTSHLIIETTTWTKTGNPPEPVFYASDSNYTNLLPEAGASSNKNVKHAFINVGNQLMDMKVRK